ncbi:MAG: signal recognition particle protein, partial [Candidatus Hydrogenedentota bacterium]
MFGSLLTEKFEKIIRMVTGVGRLSENNIEEACREVQFALLEADVHFSIVKKFINRVKEKALGSEVIKSVTPGQMFIKIIYNELVDILGNTEKIWNLERELPHRVLFIGLQGSGKTTTAAKLANYLINKKKLTVLLAAADIYRPAAQEQLRILGEKLGLTTILPEKNELIDTFTKRVINIFNDIKKDVLIFDTAGRMEIDHEMMDELVLINEILKPDSSFLILDAMTGQQAATMTMTFKEKIPITGAILTKLDSDARGGAALSFKEITGMPIYFYGSGEKILDFEIFYPQRIASRILGMGDIISFVEKAESSLDKEIALKLQKKIKRADFDFTDFLSQIEQIQKMGSLQDMLQYLPGVSKIPIKNLQVSGKEISRIKAIIQAMTKDEREDPQIINGSRRSRIAAGSGTSPNEVNQ